MVHLRTGSSSLALGRHVFSPPFPFPWTPRFKPYSTLIESVLFCLDRSSIDLVVSLHECYFESLDNLHYLSVIEIEFLYSIHEFEKPLPIQSTCFSKFVTTLNVPTANFQPIWSFTYVCFCNRRYLELGIFSNSLFINITEFFIVMCHLAEVILTEK